jgi:nucleotide-binding universal stress UspA family protein
MQPIKNILCPTDFSPSSEAAVALAVDLAKQLKSRVVLVHILQPPVYVGWEESPVALAATAELLDQSRERATQQLSAAVTKLGASGLQVESQVHDGTPHQQIAELSKQFDLVVMGTHGRTGLPHLLLGSVAERVVRTAHCPVLTVPMHKPD